MAKDPQSLTVEDYQAIVRDWLNVLIDQEDAINQTDARIGDGDHGTNMKVMAEAGLPLTEADVDTVDTFFKRLSLAFISAASGTSSLLYGGAFNAMAASFKKSPSLAKAVQAAINSIVQMGQAQAGDKTLLDMWLGASDLIDQEIYDEAALAELLDKIRNYQAKVGRAAYYKEASIGEMDAGVLTSAYFFKSLFDYLQ